MKITIKGKRGMDQLALMLRREAQWIKQGPPGPVGAMGATGEPGISKSEAAELLEEIRSFRAELREKK